MENEKENKEEKETIISVLNLDTGNMVDMDIDKAFGLLESVISLNTSDVEKLTKEDITGLKINEVLSNFEVSICMKSRDPTSENPYGIMLSPDALMNMFPRLDRRMDISKLNIVCMARMYFIDELEKGMDFLDTVKIDSFNDIEDLLKVWIID